jgi:hypothetical protein
MATTQQGAADTGATSQINEDGSTPQNQSARSKPVRKPSAREEALARVAAQVDARNVAQARIAVAEGHPIALAQAAERKAQGTAPAGEDEAQPIQFDDPEGVAADEADDGSAAQVAVVQPTQAAKVTQATDPSAIDGIVMRNGKAMMVLKVDGQTRELPLETARATLQKSGAAEARLQQASELKRSLDARDQQLRTREAALTAREKQVPTSQASAASAANLDDASLDSEAKGLVKSLMSDSEEVAAGKLAAVLKKVRAPAVAQPAAIDVNAVAERAATVAEQRITARETNKDLVSGFQSFETDYPEIAADPNLYRYADGLTNTIATEHPEWAPSKVMAEAGKQTREWVDSLSGKKPAPATGQQPNNRQVRKDNLRPMPTTRTATRQAEVVAAVPTPADLMAEIRKGRGQPV